MQNFILLANDLQLTGWDYFALFIISLIFIFAIFHFVNLAAKACVQSVIWLLTNLALLIVFPIVFIIRKIDEKVNPYD